MPFNRILLGAALGVTGCAHTIDVFVPASDVPPKTVVDAAVRTGEVRSFDQATMDTKSVVREKGVAVPFAPTDVLVVRAAAGDTLGHVHVARAATSELLTLGGILVGLAGTIASLAAAGACGSNGAFSTDEACLAGGIAGTGASVLLGGFMVAMGVNGPLRVIEDRRPALVSFDGHSLRIRF